MWRLKFHPLINSWFSSAFGEPTECQRLAWPRIADKQHVLISAPTGSGKTFAAFLGAIDKLLRQGLDAGYLPDQTGVVYVSPLRALSNDIERNLRQPLQGIQQQAKEFGELPEIRIAVRTGDTTSADRDSMRRRPPHILVTTPESLCILLTSESGRRMLSTVHSVIVDEIHALAGNKRGAHLALSLERLVALTGRAVTRVGLSATQKPVTTVAQFLSGSGGDPVAVIECKDSRSHDLAIELPRAPLTAVMAGEVWSEIYTRLELSLIHI